MVQFNEKQICKEADYSPGGGGGCDPSYPEYGLDSGRDLSCLVPGRRRGQGGGPVRGRQDVRQGSAQAVQPEHGEAALHGCPEQEHAGHAARQLEGWHLPERVQVHAGHAVQ